MIRLLLAGRHALARQGLRRILEQDRDIRVVGEGDVLAALVDRARRGTADLVLIDAEGLDEQLQRELEASDPARPWCGVVLVERGDAAQVAAAVRAGIHGVLSKGVGGEALVHAVKAAASGLAVLGREFCLALARPPGGAAHRLTPAQRAALARLTPREREVLALLVAGLTTRQVAETLVVTTKTVRNHISNCMAKLGVTTRAGLALLATGAVNSQLELIPGTQEAARRES